MAGAEAYFVGRAELLNWINSTLEMNLTKVEQARPSLLRPVPAASAARPLTRAAPQTANGAVACQLVDALHPGSIPLSKVRASRPP